MGKYSGMDVFAWGKGCTAANPNQRSTVAVQNPPTETKKAVLMEEEKIENRDNTTREKRKFELEGQSEKCW